MPPLRMAARIVWSDGRLQIWLDIDNSGHYQSCVQTEKGDARMRMPEKARHVTPHLTVLRSLCHPLTPLAPAFLQGHFGVSASTGSFGDTHVVYSFQLADLEDGDIHDVEATPYTGARLWDSNSDGLTATRSPSLARLISHTLPYTQGPTRRRTASTSTRSRTRHTSR